MSPQPPVTLFDGENAAAAPATKVGTSLPGRFADWLFGYDFFISYSQRDGKVLPQKLKALLQERGFHVFLDQTEYVPGIDLRKETRRQVRKSKTIVVICRENALASEWVLREVRVALEVGKLPILLNINQAVQSASGSSELAVMALEQHWLRFDESLSAADDAPSDLMVSELARAFKYTRQEVKRLRMVSATMIVLAATAVIASWQAYEASRQRNAAERNFKIARETADGLVVKMARGLRDVEGMRTENVRKILEQAEAALLDLSNSVSNDTEILRSQISMYAEFVETYLALGDTDMATKSASAAVKAARQVLGGRPGLFNDQRALSLALLKQGDTLAEVGRLEEAERSYVEALKIREQLENAEPENLLAKRETSVAWMRLTDLEIQRKRWVRAQEHVSRVLEIRQKLVQRMPQWRRDLGLTYLYLSDIQLELKTWEAARNSALAAFAEFEQMAADKPGDTKAARDRAVALQRLGNVEIATGRYDAARDTYQRSLDRFIALSRSDEANIEWQRDVLVAKGKLAEVMTAKGLRDEAIAQWHDIVEARQRLVNKSPNVAVLVQDLKEARLNLAKAMH